jgi:hypothetical protein
MRVNIQYSVNIEELPELTVQLLIKSIENIDMEALEALGATTNSDDTADPMSLGTAETIDQLRQSLAATDALLSDVYNIITGYLNYKTTATTTPPSSPPIPVEELERKLAEFKNSLPSQDNELTD